MEDRRIQKTKRYLSEALIALILEKGYEKVTIQDIIDRANTGRSTFYAHYESKEQLLLDGHKNLGVRLFEEGTEFSFKAFFEHAAENADLARAMFGKNSGHLMLGHFKAHIAHELRRKLGTVKTRNDQDERLQNYTADAAAAMVISFLVSWLEEGMLLPAVQIASACEKCVGKLFEPL